jgi:hypothetical protein
VFHDVEPSRNAVQNTDQVVTWLPGLRVILGARGETLFSLVSGQFGSEIFSEKLTPILLEQSRKLLYCSAM